MTWMKKDVEVLGFEVEEPNSRNMLEINHYHSSCLPEWDQEYSAKITGHVTKETLDRDSDKKLLCDRCREEIK